VPQKKEELAMAIVTMTLADLPPELTEEEIAELEAAEKMPITYDEDCPEMTSEQLKQFVRVNSLRLNFSGEDAEKIRELGPNYRQILERLLSMALSDSEMVKKCMEEIN
jgi:hypothetical protein